MTLGRRLFVYLGLCAAACCLALISVYSYGKWFSHDRYWNGTIARVQYNQTRLLADLLMEVDLDTVFLSDPARLKRVFAALENHLIVEVTRSGELVFSNDNQRYVRGEILRRLELVEPDWEITLSSYRPPLWHYTFVRWLKNPSRWLEPSFDYVTFPFVWFLVIHALALVALGFVASSRYLRRDVLAVLQRLESERNQL